MSAEYVLWTKQLHQALLWFRQWAIFLSAKIVNVQFFNYYIFTHLYHLDCLILFVHFLYLFLNMYVFKFQARVIISFLVNV